MPNNIFEWIALVDPWTPLFAEGKKLKNRQFTHLTYQGSGRDIELASGILKAAGIQVMHNKWDRSLVIHPDDMYAVDETLKRAGFEVTRQGYIKKR